MAAGRPLTANEQLLDAMVRHQLGLLRYSGSVRNDVWALLDATEADIRAQIARRLRRGPGGEVRLADLRRMERLFEDLRETRVAAWSQVSALWMSEMRELALAEARTVAGLIQVVAPVRLDMVIPDAEVLRSIVTDRPFQGELLATWAKKVRDADIDRIEQQIRMGMVQGEDVPQISRRIVGTVSMKGTNGVTQVARRNAAAITRTAVMHTASQASRELALANLDVTNRELFVATLDSRTTPVCRAYDGKVFLVGEGPVLPLHWGERSRRVLLIDGQAIGERPMKPVTERMLVDEFARREGIKPVPRRRQDLPRGTRGDFDAFSRRRIRELTGPVPAHTTYDDFLKRQPAAVQDDILGPTRGRLYRAGGVTLERFVDRVGNEIPLRELARLDAEAFRAAGLDPERYL